MSVGRTKISHKQEAAIAALLTEKSHEAAAGKAGISPATLSRWLKLSEFKAAYRQARRQIVETAIGRLQQATDRAVEALERNLTCGHPGSEIRAAAAILEQATKAVELSDLAARLEEVEALLQEIDQYEANQTSGQAA